MYKLYFKFLLISFFIAGCTVTSVPVPQSRVVELSKQLQALDKSIPTKEAMLLSRDIFKQTSKLTKEFKLTSPPWFHNFLVNTGLREKGLCYHWSDGLYVYFLDKEYPSFEFHLLGANIGEYLYEHNTLVVVAKGAKVLDGVLVDPWRDSGKLYFSNVKEDKKYKWSHRAYRGCQR
jgi:hypothetical protein